MNGKQKDSKVDHHANSVGGDASAIEDAISRQLRDFYDSVAEEPIPDRFIDLLEKLDEAEKEARPESGVPDDDA